MKHLSSAKYRNFAILDFVISTSKNKNRMEENTRYTADGESTRNFSNYYELPDSRGYRFYHEIINGSVWVVYVTFIMKFVR